ncbi:6,7-dimethyl-8-ribityllumazine synthase [bacterium]|nr:6,7-dimethyl-8-ribityllumazine synthase [bacterium]
MVKNYEGHLTANEIKVGIIVSRFNDFITRNLLEGALDCLRRHGANDKQYDIVWVPGAFEIPVAAKKLISKGGYDGVLCLGAVIRGDTPHFEYVAAEVTKGIAQLGLSETFPLSYGIITADTIEQAIERAGTKAGNKGWTAAQSLLEMIDLFKKMQIG